MTEFLRNTIGGDWPHILLLAAITVVLVMSSVYCVSRDKKDGWR
jgi:hypothetical protein